MTTVLERIPVVGRFFKRKHSKNFLFLFWQEINRNVERYYIVDQRQFICEPFELEAWAEARDFSGIRFNRLVYNYVRGVEEFNRTFLDMKVFEEDYLSSVANKTRANAEILHVKKEALQEKLEELRPLVFMAQKQLHNLIENQTHGNKADSMPPSDEMIHAEA